MGMVAPSGPRLVVDARRLWAGGAATAAVAALVATVGVVLCRDVLGFDMAQPPSLPIGDSFLVRYAVTAAVLALAATGLAHLLALTTPRPASFFSWIVGLATVVGVVVPLAGSGSPGGRLASALVDLVIGLCILTLVRSVLSRTVQRIPPEPWQPPDPSSPLPPATERW